MINDDELTRRLAHEAAARATVSVPPDLVARMVADTRARAAAGSLRRRLAAGVAGAAIIGGGVAAAPAAADAVRHFVAQTGLTFAGTEVAAGSEFIDTSAPDFGAYLETIYPGWLPLAPGQTRAGVIEQVRAERATNPGVAQEVDLRRSLEHAAYVGWIDEWMAAHEAGDSERMTAAADPLTEAASWPAFTATAGGGNTFIMAAFAREIAAGNYAAAQEAAQVDGASSWDGVDRAGSANSYFSRFLDEYRAQR